MPKLNRKKINSLEDGIARDSFTMKYLKCHLMKTYRLPARKAKTLSIKIEKDGCEYWFSDYY